MTSEAIKVNPNLNGLKLSRARFLRLIAFHQNFFQQMLPDESGMISILNILFIDLELLISTFEVRWRSFYVCELIFLCPIPPEHVNQFE